MKIYESLIITLWNAYNLYPRLYTRMLDCECSLKMHYSSTEENINEIFTPVLWVINLATLKYNQET